MSGISLWNILLPLLFSESRTHSNKKTSKTGTQLEHKYLQSIFHILPLWKICKIDKHKVMYNQRWYMNVVLGKAFF